MKLSAVVMLLCLMLGACAQKQKIPAATYMGGNHTITEICKELDTAGASHVDTFREWVTDFADSAGKNAKLEDVWSDPENMKADIGKCMDGWEQNHDYSDTDCRMTAFLLLDGLLHAESTEDNYEGTYLMFDTEAIDNVERYETIKENRDMFTTLYGEKSVADKKHPETAFSDSWEHYGFQIDSDRISLLSIVIYDPYSDVTFVQKQPKWGYIIILKYGNSSAYPHKKRSHIRYRHLCLFCILHVIIYKFIRISF